MMTAIAPAPAPSSDPVARKPARPPARPARPSLARLRAASDRGFRRALVVALALHLSLMLGFLTAPESLTQKRLGEPDADPNGVSVEIVDMADLKSRTNVPLMGSPPEPMPQPQQQPTPKPPEKQAKPPEPTPEPEQSQLQPQQQPSQPQAAEPPPQQPAKEAPREKTEAIEAPGNPPPSEPPAEQPKPAPPTKHAARPPAPSSQQAPQRRVLDLSIPPSALNITPRDVGAQRPPGITQSGENDQFGRGVINALWRTFPQLRTTGVVGVRFVLNTKGNLTNIVVTRSSGDSNLDQTIVFAVKQASFPIPPDNSTEVDRTFLITYIYR